MQEGKQSCLPCQIMVGKLTNSLFSPFKWRIEEVQTLSDSVCSCTSWSGLSLHLSALPLRFSLPHSEIILITVNLTAVFTLNIQTDMSEQTV